MSVVILAENLSKHYRLGVIGYGTLREDFQSWWARFRGKEDPNLPVALISQDGKSPRVDTIMALQDISLARISIPPMLLGSGSYIVMAGIGISH
ncbi:MAG: hypothetical protein NTW27_06790 [Deltaproteobacteria bacterium]|nr:hypothetical protein [Deltaproteobacteria bacterium]